MQGLINNFVPSFIPSIDGITAKLRHNSGVITPLPQSKGCIDRLNPLLIAEAKTAWIGQMTGLWSAKRNVSLSADY